MNEEYDMTSCRSIRDLCYRVRKKSHSRVVMTESDQLIYCSNLMVTPVKQALSESCN